MSRMPQDQRREPAWSQGIWSTSTFDEVICAWVESTAWAAVYQPEEQKELEISKKGLFEPFLHPDMLLPKNQTAAACRPQGKVLKSAHLSWPCPHPDPLTHPSLPGPGVPACPNFCLPLLFLTLSPHLPLKWLTSELPIGPHSSQFQHQSSYHIHLFRLWNRGVCADGGRSFVSSAQRISSCEWIHIAWINKEKYKRTCYTLVVLL